MKPTNIFRKLISYPIEIYTQTYSTPTGGRFYLSRITYSNMVYLTTLKKNLQEKKVLDKWKNKIYT